MTLVNGYIYLWKKITDTSFYKDSYAVHLALHLLLKVNYKDTKIVFNGQEVIIKRGEHLCGGLSLAKETGMNRSMIRRKLKLLEKVGFIYVKSTNKFSIVTICKYNDFQTVKSVSDQQLTIKRPTTDHQMTTPKEVKEDKEDKDLNTLTDFDIFWKAYPRKKSKGSAKKAWLRINPSEHLLATMLATIEIAKTSNDWTKDGGKWIPYPASWLNAEGWEDEYTVSGREQTSTEKTREALRIAGENIRRKEQLKALGEGDET